MPICLHQLTPVGVLGAWELTEPTSWFLAQAAEKSIHPIFHHFKHEGRVRQFIASRLLIRELEPGLQVLEGLQKGPRTAVDGTHSISFSHTNRMACAYVSPHHSVGIDAECDVEKIDRIAQRFLHPNELHWLSKNKALRLAEQALIWAAKEAVFKRYHKHGLLFGRHLACHPIHLPNPKEMQMSVTLGEAVHLEHLKILKINGHWVVYTI
jgi:phosphopantetheinyl transferase (holo-ACP synthase)